MQNTFELEGEYIRAGVPVQNQFQRREREGQQVLKSLKGLRQNTTLKHYTKTLLHRKERKLAKAKRCNELYLHL